MGAGTPAVRPLSPTRWGAGKGPLNVPRPFEFPKNLTGNDRVETKRHGTICPTDGSPRRGSPGRHRLGSPGSGPGVGHPHAVQRAGREHRWYSRAGGGDPRLERRIRRLQSPADDGAGDPRRGCQFPQLPRRTLAAGGASRRFARAVRGQRCGPHSRSADHGSARCPARIHQIVLGLSRHPGERGSHPEWAGDSRPAPRHLRRGREGVWCRSPLHRRDLGRRIQLRHADRRALGDPFDGVDSVPDVIASTANNLKKDGWVTGQTWGYEVVVPKGFNFMLADRSRVMSVQEWERAGIRRAGGKAFPRVDDRAYLLVPAGAQGPGFLMLQNFRVIMKYNPAEAYALAIGHLADRLRGGEPFVQAWPRQERVLTRAERYELQQHLAARGYDVGEPDGRLGGKTRNALRQFQSSVGHVPDGFASAAILERLRSR